MPKRPRRPARPSRRKRPAASPPAPPQRAGFPIVGIAASAGGLEALRRFFVPMVPSPSMGFVIVQHLDPNRRSLMTELLAKYTSMPVVEAADGMRVERDHVYMIPPNRYLTIRGGVLRLAPGARDQRDRPAFYADHFFESLAEDQAEKAIGIVLTGTGSDGTKGIRAIKAAGGMVMVQDPATAVHDGMPQSSVSTGIVDFVMPVEEMAAALRRYVQHWYVSSPAPIVAPGEKKPDELSSIFAVLRARIKHDFRAYKKSTVLRRIQRRMGLNQVERMSDYVELLRKNPAEVTHLFKDLLISVTSFFRERKAFDELTRVIGRLVAEKDPGAPVRVWVPGCATGEEAYSLGIILLEALAAHRKESALQIFATDIDEDAIEIARAGVYPESITADIATERLRKFFKHNEHSHTYVVGKTLRECVIFAPQNVISAPPFSRLDLVSCRNLLIYLEPEVQKKVINLFHFSLLPGGILFLGSSETAGHDEGLFRTVSKKWRIYRREGTTGRGGAPFPVIPEIDMTSRAEGGARHARQANIGALVQQALMQHYAPAAVLIDKNGDILHFHGGTGKFLDMPAGEPNLNLFNLTNERLRSSLRVAVQKVVREDSTLAVEASLKQKGKVAPVRVTIRPIRSSLAGDRLYLVVFEDEPAAAEVAPAAGVPAPAAELEGLVKQLEAELKSTREELQNTVEQMETSGEELRASNEEVMSMNEELQSANEELETSKEEMQSLNEELSTVNSQLESKVEELTSINNDLANLLASTELATVFLDMDLRIKRFTRASTRLLNLIQSDVGRPITDITHHLKDVDFRRDAEEVIRHLTPIRREVQSKGGEWYVLRVLPYRTSENAIQGAVITFMDVTELVASTRLVKLRERQQEFIASLGRRALVGESMDRLMSETVMAVRDLLAADASYVLEPGPSGDVLVMRAGAGWDSGAEKLRIPINSAGAVASAFRGAASLLIDDLAKDERHRDDGLSAKGMKSGILVRIQSREGHLGLLGAFSREAAHFTEHDVNVLETMAAVIADAFALKADESRHVRKSEMLEAEVQRRTGWLTLLQDVTRAANESESVDEVMSYTLQRIGETNGWMYGQSYLRVKEDPADYFAPLQDWTADNRTELKKLRDKVRNVRHRMDEGLLRRLAETTDAVIVDRVTRETVGDLADVAKSAGVVAVLLVPVRLGTEVVGALEFFSSQPLHSSPALVTLFGNVGMQLGRVVERMRFQEAYTEAVWQEQRRIAQELHDGVGQELVGVSMSAKMLTQKLEGRSAIEDAEKVLSGIQVASEKISALARGAYAVEVDAADFMAAMERLALATTSMYSVTCTFESEGGGEMSDNRVASQLFRIAREAVTNAVRHGKPKNIRIRLKIDPTLLEMKVHDDGVGITRGGDGKGIGLRIMRNRASSIGATIQVESAPQKGTTITVTRAAPERGK